MRSPGDSSFPAISEPPTKMVPSTMPAGTGRLWVLPHCGSRPPPRGSCPPWGHSPLSARLESPWKAAMPSPSRWLSWLERSASAQYSLWVGG